MPRRIVSLASCGVRQLAAAIFAFLLACGALHAQTQAPAQTQAQQASPQAPPLAQGKITSQVKAVTLYATVRDKKGKIVSTLTKDDFSLDDEGAPQTISYFARESDVPLTLGPLVDTSLSQRYVIGDERDASYVFLDHMLRDKDKAFLIHFDREVELLQDLTNSRDKLKRAVGELQIAAREQDASTSAGSGGGDPDDSGDRRGGGRDFRGGTLLYDAIFLASNELMKKQQGRKALIVLSDGIDRGSKEFLNSAIESAQRADTAIYTILFSSEEEDHDNGPGNGRHGGGHVGLGGPFPFPGGGPGGGGYPGGGGGGYPGGGGGGQRRGGGENRHADGKKVMQQLAGETGGRFFEVSKKVSVEQIYAQIEEELRNQYSLAFTPTPADSSGRYHKIHVTLKDKDLTVAAREGYYAQ